MIDEFDDTLDSPMEENSFGYNENDEPAHSAPFSDENGIRFSSSGKIILSFPEGTSGRLVIPEGVEHISADAFKHCGQFTEIVIPSTLKTLHYSNYRKQNSIRHFEVHPDNIFMHTDSTGSMLYNQDFTTLFKASCDYSDPRLPFGLIRIGNYAFQYCTKLTNIVLSDTITDVGASAFAHCTRLSDITISPSQKKLTGWLFMDCSSLEHITIPNNIRRIGTGTFAQCTNLKEIHLPEYLQVINSQAFLDCQSLTEIFIPRFVKSIGAGAFDGCTELCNITVDEDNAKLSSDKGVLYNKYQSQLLRCPEGSRSFDLPELLSSLAPSAFAGCRNLKSINLPQYIISIPDYCFSDCTELQSIALPQGLIAIGNSAFEGCGELKEISLPPTLQSIGDYAFSGCASIEKIDLPRNLSEIGRTNAKEDEKTGCTFYGCTSLKELSIPNRVSSLNEYCFGNCTSLELVSISYMIDFLNNDLFSGCTNLKKVILNNPYTVIEDGTFDENVEIVVAKKNE